MTVVFVHAKGLGGEVHINVHEIAAYRGYQQSYPNEERVEVILGSGQRLELRTDISEFSQRVMQALSMLHGYSREGT